MADEYHHDDIKKSRSKSMADARKQRFSEDHLCSITTNNSSEINRRKSSHKVAYLYDSNKSAPSVSSNVAEIMIAVEIFENEVIHSHIKALI